MGRVAVFIDAGYLNYVLRDFGRPSIDYGEFADELAGDDDLLRTYYYDCLPYQSPNPTQEESERFGRKQSFFNALSRIDRFTVRQGELAFRGYDQEDGEPIFVQKRVDIKLGVDLVLLATKGQITRAAVVTGDSDFLPAIRAAKNEGVLLDLYHGEGRNEPHRELWDAVDDRNLIEQDLIDGCEM